MWCGVALCGSNHAVISVTLERVMNSGSSMFMCSKGSRRGMWSWKRVFTACVCVCVYAHHGGGYLKAPSHNPPTHSSLYSNPLPPLPSPTLLFSPPPTLRQASTDLRASSPMRLLGTYKHTTLTNVTTARLTGTTFV